MYTPSFGDEAVAMFEEVVRLQDKAARCDFTLHVTNTGHGAKEGCSRRVITVFCRKRPITVYETDSFILLNAFLEGVESTKSIIFNPEAQHWYRKEARQPQGDFPFMVFVPTGDQTGFAAIACNSTDSRVRCIVDSKDLSDSYTHWMHLPIFPNSAIITH